MEIGEIKAKLSITNVLAHYGITTIKNKQINCPFHNDKIPSPAPPLARASRSCQQCMSNKIPPLPPESLRVVLFKFYIL